MLKYLQTPLDNALGKHWGHFLFNFIVVLYCVAIYPAIIRLFSRYDKAESEPVGEKKEPEKKTDTVN